tara:strand:+ start:19 stop:195 length:177 start_codon:yes stop_codon:yes gene_type:complete
MTFTTLADIQEMKGGKGQIGGGYSYDKLDDIRVIISHTDFEEAAKKILFDLGIKKEED